MRPFTTYVGIDLGGARGKTTAIAVLRPAPSDPERALVAFAATRHGSDPWTDSVLVSFLAEQKRAVVAMDAPLTVPACLRCTLEVCPGADECEVPSVAWLRTEGKRLESNALQSSDRIAAIPATSGFVSSLVTDVARTRLAPYTHRCTEVSLHYQRDLLPRESLGQGVGPLLARGQHLRRVLAGHGFELNENLLEVSPRATIKALFGGDKARGYKRDADPWATRAAIIEGLGASLSFAPESRLSREEALQNDHCFDALVCAYTAFLWARDDWQMPNDEHWREDGWIWSPPENSAP